MPWRKNWNFDHITLDDFFLEGGFSCRHLLIIAVSQDLNLFHKLALGLNHVKTDTFIPSLSFLWTCPAWMSLVIKSSLQWGKAPWRRADGKPKTSVHWTGGEEFDARNWSRTPTDAHCTQPSFTCPKWDICFIVEGFVPDGREKRSPSIRTHKVVTATKRSEGWVSRGQRKGSSSYAIEVPKGGSCWWTWGGTQLRCAKPKYVMGT